MRELSHGHPFLGDALGYKRTCKFEPTNAILPDPIFKTEHRNWLILLAVIVIGAILRCIPVHESLWIDELHTAWTVVGEGNEIAHRARLGNNSLVYFVIVRMFTDLLGVSEWTLRLPSILCGCAIIPLTYAVARHWKCSLPAALLASGLVAIDANNLYFSGEARTYAMVQVVSLVHLFLFSVLVVQQHKTWTWIFWIISGIVLFHLHCTSALILVAELVAYLSLQTMRRETGMHWLYFVIGLLIIGLAVMPALPLVRQLADRRENWALFVSRTRNPVAMLWIYPLQLYVLAPAACGIGIRGLKRFRLSSAGENLAIEDEANLEQTSFLIPVVIAASWILVPISLAWVLTELDVARLFFRRYVIASSVALAPLTAIIFSRLVGNRRGWLVSIVVLAVGVYFISPAKHLRYGAAAFAHSAEDWRTPIATINESDPIVSIVLYSGLIEADEWHNSTDPQKQEYCELPVRGIYQTQANRPVIVLPKTSVAVISKSQLREIGGAAWLLIRGGTDQAERTRMEVLSSLGEGWTASEPNRSGRVHLLRLHSDSVEEIANP